MAQKKTAKETVEPATTIYAAERGRCGVLKLAELKFEAAVNRRKEGLDIVVCGDDHATNAKRAKEIEAEVTERYILHKPHDRKGCPKNSALPHCQPENRPPDGHTFYETENRRAAGGKA